MQTIRQFAIGITLFASPWISTPSQANPRQSDNASAVATLLAERCAECHTPDSDDPKARRGWDGAKDILATVSNPDWIVPGNAADSELLQQVLFDEMPPDDSGVATFTEIEKALLTAWVVEGAPVPEKVETGSGGPSSNSELAESLPAKRTSKDGWMQTPLVRWLGRFHPMLVHFPIALLTVVFLAELVSRITRRPKFAFVADCCLVLGAAASVPAAAMGWVLAATSPPNGEELEWHRWLGVSSVVVSLTVLFVIRKNPKLRLPLFAVLATLIGITGHLGGSLTYGSDWLDWPGSN